MTGPRLLTRDAAVSALLRWVRAAGLVVAFLATGRVVDAIGTGGPTAGTYVVGALGCLVAGGADLIAERRISSLAATTATTMRGTALRSVLAADRLPVLTPSGHPGSRRPSEGQPTGGRKAQAPGARASGAQPSVRTPSVRTRSGAPTSGHGATSGPSGSTSGPSGTTPRPSGAPATAPSGRPGDQASAEGAVVEALTGSVEKVAAYRAGFLGPTLGSFTVPVLVLVGVAVGVSWRVALLQVPFVLVVAPLVGLAMRLTRSTAGRYRRSTASLTSLFLETIGGLGTLQLLGAWRRRGVRIAQASERARVEVMRLLRSSQLVILATDAIFGILLVTATVWLGLSELRAGRITPGQATALLLLTTVLIEPVQRLGRSFYVGMAGAAIDRRLSGLTGGKPGVEEPRATRAPSAVAVTLTDASVTLGGRTVLDHVSLDIPAGAWVAVVGPSGSGKSTLLSAIQGLIVATGVIRVGDEADPQRRLREVTTVRQRSFLFSGTVADNLRLADRDADEDALWAALRVAQLAEDVASWPRALDTPVGEGGLGLSGGQARRIALARAALADTPVLLLDEVTADLDLETQARVTRAVSDLAGSRTVVSVAHRLETTALADRVVVLVDGRIVDAGTRDELAGRPGWFADALAVGAAR